MYAFSKHALTCLEHKAQRAATATTERIKEKVSRVSKKRMHREARYVNNLKTVLKAEIIKI